MSATHATESTVDATPATATAPVSPWAARLECLEQWLAAASDYANPILVKETRQAIKSRQFMFTFVLLLIFCWIITIGGVALLGPGVYYTAAGGILLKAYYVVLIFPLTVVVPFSAFRSLAGEREENTYDLLRVSTLTPRQIISGKLGSAMVQMGVYLSAVAPCVAFTYLLRGVDVLTIAVLLAYAVLGCCGLSMAGLFAAALSQRKQGQVLLSVGFVSGLLGCFWSGVLTANEMLSSGGSMVREPWFLIFNTALLTLLATSFALCFLATVALITFRTENRSTPLRWAMLVQQTAFVGWMALAWLESGYDSRALLVTFMVAAAYWYAMGTLLTTESSELSHRVRRRLPNSTVGRVLLSWFNPGPGTGYVFATANLTGVGLFALAGYLWADQQGLAGPSSTNFPVVVGFVAIWSYMVAYLGLGKLLVAGLRKFVDVSAVAGFLLHVLLLLAGSGLPYAIQMSVRSLRNSGYNLLQWPNPFWSVNYLLEQPAWSIEAVGQTCVLFGVAVCMLLVNLPSIARGIRLSRVALPTRVAEDEAALHPVVARPQNPWEEDAALSSTESEQA